LSLSGNLDANGTSVSYEVSTDGGATWSATSATQTGLADGDYRFHAIVTDPAGNSSTSNVRSEERRVGTATACPRALTNLNDSGSAYARPATTYASDDLSLSGNLDANGTSVSYEVSTDGGATWSATSATQTGLADGDYRFHAIVTDPAGNSSTSNVIEIVSDNTGPTATTLARTHPADSK